MSTSAVIAKVDKILIPLGFRRKKLAWNRRREDSVDVIDIQVSKSGEQITANAGILNIAAHEKFSGEELPGFVEEQECTARVRIGFMMGNVDKWWDLDDGDTPDAISGAILQYLLPFLERTRSSQDMERFLANEALHPPRYPTPAIYRAILLHDLGHRHEAANILFDLSQRTSGAWKDRIHLIKLRLES